MATSTVMGYHYDSDNLFYDGTRIVQVIDGVANYPKCVLENAPAGTAGYWYKCNSKATGWTSVKKPTTCAEAVEAGLSAVANSPKQHDREVKALLENLVKAESDKYKTVIGAGMVMTVEAIPEPTEEEKEIERKRAEQEEREETIRAVKSDMITAIANNDTDWLEELRTEYAELMAEEE